MEMMGITRDLSISASFRLHLVGRTPPMFQICGYAGLLLGFIQSMVLVWRLNLSQVTMVGITGVVILTFLALAMTTKVLTARENITFYHHEIAALAMVASFLRVTRQPLVPYLDVTVLGIGLFLSFGRLGCLSAGCCHGRPSRRGVRYGDEHARAGFPQHLVGVRLCPIQAVESVAVLLIVATGVVMLLQGSKPGLALAWYVMSYGVVRFCLEFIRGDDLRPYWLGFSEAQWTTLILMLGIVWAEHSKQLPLGNWHVPATLVVAAAMAVIMFIRSLRRTPLHLFLQPRHVREFAEAIARLSGESQNRTGENSATRIAHTSLGIQISAGSVPYGVREVRHYTLSSSVKPLTAKAARHLSNLMLCLRFPAESAQLLEAGDGVFHCLVNLPVNVEEGTEED